MAHPKGSRIPTENALELLGTLTAYRYKRTSFIHGELPHRGLYGLVDQLRKFRNWGWVFNPPEANDYYRYHHSDYIHSITPKGLEMAQSWNCVRPQVTRVYRRKPERGEKLEDVKVKNFAHAMMICDTLNSIEIACLQEGIEFIPWGAIQDKMTDPQHTGMSYSISYDGNSHRSSIVPDGMFGLRYPNGRLAYFSLECELDNPVTRSNLEQSSWLKKSLAYADILKRGDYCEQFGIPDMRVLTVTPSFDKSIHQQQVTKDTTTPLGQFDPRRHMYFSSVPEHKHQKRSPKPFPELVTRPIRRGGFPELALYDREKGERMRAEANATTTDPRVEM